MRDTGQAGTKWLCITPRISSGSANISAANLLHGPPNNSCGMPFSTLRPESGRSPGNKTRMGNGTQEAQEAQEVCSLLVPLVLLVFRSPFSSEATFRSRNNRTVKMQRLAVFHHEFGSGIVVL